MAEPSDAPADPGPPGGFDLTTPPADFDLTAPAFGLTPPTFDGPPPTFQAAPPPLTFQAAPPALAGAADADVPPAEARPGGPGLGFVAAPVQDGYAAPPAGTGPDGDPAPAAAADPSYIWDLAATDVFPVAGEADVRPEDGEG
jgi:hypothetical protein